ncbi:MAG: 50S ribosomal protein L25/general stress protein Ctc [Gammaproteobacteria bacterium]|nr:50S ribosomal protein L25/general stress protein Ctc [Gammaproteobacteria bacterium]
MENFIVNAKPRTDTGKGASRRLRHTGYVPGIVYGGGSAPEMLVLEHNEMVQHLEHEAFYSHILTLNLDGKEEKVVLKDLQRHPAKPFIQHVDFLRVVEGSPIRMTVPLHFKGETTAPGVKRGGTATKYMTSVEVACKPADLPEFIEINVGALDVSESIHLADISLPEGVSFPALARGPEHNYAVVAVLGGRNVK